MTYIKGKFKKVLYHNESNNYTVALFKVKETDDIDVKKFLNKDITTTGSIVDLKLDYTYTLNGEYTIHPKYKDQFTYSSYERHKPSTASDIIDFLSSPFVEGCGDATAKKLVDRYGDATLDKIKESIDNIMVIKGMTTLKAMKIYTSVLNFDKNDEIIKNLLKMNFSLEDASKILSKHSMEIDAILEGNLYLLKDVFDFNKIDEIYKNYFDHESALRCKNCILEAMITISFNEGSTYYYKEDIYKAISALYNLNINDEDFSKYLDSLIKSEDIVLVNNRYYLTKYYTEEKQIAKYLYDITSYKTKTYKNLDVKLEDMQKALGFAYNEEQKKAIINSLNNNLSIISGGPGTGKTTIINAIVKTYIAENKLSAIDIMSNIALLAPTGRASKRLSTSTGLPAYTIHRYLRWHKDTDSFEYNENNKLPVSLCIVDETSMLDTSLMYSLLSALKENAKVILVGDIYQLPSVGPGLILQDLINSDYFCYNPLNIIYRQSDNSYIPFLAKDIKMQNIDEEFMYKRDDYNFIVSSEEDIINKIVSTVKYALTKGINEDNMQILAPMYKGINGIDNLNNYLQNIYNPEDKKKNETTYGDKIYREGDKVLQLINDSDVGVFNGDIGKIISISKNNLNKIVIRIDFDGNVVEIEKKDLKNITHAYAITIHKSQGSEFEHVVMPVCRSYFIMLYNKLLYTGVSRAKKSLTIIGEPNAFAKGVANNYASERKTSLIIQLKNLFEANV